MTLTEAARSARSPYRNLCIILAMLIPAALLAFVPSYSSGLTFAGQPVTLLVHLHAALMVLWVLMLISQAWFIRTKRFSLHMWVGRSSLLIAPLIILSALATVQDGIVRNPDGITAENVRIKIFGLGMTLAFAMTWGLGILYRRRTPIHVRLMVSTAFAFGSAILFRIIGHWFAWVPGLGKGNTENIAVVNGAVLVLILVGLIANDWRIGIKRSPFWVVTAVTMVIHIGYFTFTRTDWWMSLVQWYAGLPP